MAFLGPNNALAWAQFRLRGGWYRAVTFSLGACILLALLIAGHARIATVDAPRVLYGWSSGLMVLQGMTLVIFASMRVGQGIRQDLTSKQIESHRLMPMPPMHAVAGYIIGNALPPLCFAAGEFVIGLFTTAQSGMDPQRWLFANAVLLGFCMFLWVFVAFTAFGVKFGPALVFVPLIIPLASGSGGLEILPALTLLLSPIAGISVFDLRGEPNWLSPIYAMSFAAQAYIGIILFLAAARRYRAADAVGLSTILGLCLVIGWSGLCCVALRSWESFRPRSWSGINIQTSAQLVASMVSTMILSLAPISAAARDHLRWQRHKRSRDPAPMSRPIPMTVVLMIVTLATVVIALAPPMMDTPKTIELAVTAVAVSASLLAMYFLYALVYSAMSTASMAAFVWILVAWVGPIAADMVRYGFSDVDREIVGTLAASSPIGALTIVWDGRPVEIVGGIIGLLVISSVPVIAYGMWAMRRRNHRLAPMATNEQVGAV